MQRNAISLIGPSTKKIEKKTRSKKRKKEAGNDQDSDFVSDEDSDEDYQKIEVVEDYSELQPSPLCFDKNSGSKGTPATPHELYDSNFEHSQPEQNDSIHFDLRLKNSPE